MMNRIPTSARSSRGFGILVIILLLLSACSGPKIPLKVGVKDVPTDVILGVQAAPPPPPPPGLNPDAGFPGLIQPPTPTAPVRSEPPKVACPEAHPFDAPKQEARNRATAPPTPATYAYRNAGTFRVTTTAGVSEGTFPPESQRSIRNSQRGEGFYTFEISIPLGDSTTTTLYQVIPDAGAIQSQSGVYIRQINTQSSRGTDSFTPVGMGLKLIEFPAEPNKQWDSAGADGNGNFMSFHARIGVEVPDGDDVDTAPDIQAKVRVDACGEPLDAWLVEVTEGRIVNAAAGRDINFRALYAIATQFGGFSVFDNICMNGTDGGRQISSCNASTINSLPKLPQ